MHDLSHTVRQSPEAAGVAAPASRISITVAICTRNRAALLEKAVRSVLVQADNNMGILIVDNGSTDGTAELVEKFAAADPRIRTVREPQTGLSAARNRALEQAASDWVIFLDDDAEAEPGWLAAYGNFISHPPNPRVAAAGGAVIPRCETAPPEWLEAGARFELGPEPFCFPPSGHPWECNCAYRRDAALRVGGFDLRLGHHGDVTGYHEGTELDERLRNAGCEIWWLPGAAIQHLIHARRLNLRWRLHAAFNGGRSTAIQRVKGRGPRVRRFYVVGRVLVAPFHCGINLLVALAVFPFQKGRVAVKAVLRAAAIAGFACELLKQL
jgi:glycosyltransferase involved in cell wall biosynthesis